MMKKIISVVLAVVMFAIFAVNIHALPMKYDLENDCYCTISWDEVDWDSVSPCFVIFDLKEEFNVKDREWTIADFPELNELNLSVNITRMDFKWRNVINKYDCDIYFSEGATKEDIIAVVEALDSNMYVENADLDYLMFIDDIDQLYCGDANRDGKIDANDVSLMLKYLAEWNVEIDTELADVNMDGKINSDDVTISRRV